jgi:uncharacterized delta-60 repeat protein
MHRMFRPQATRTLRRLAVDVALGVAFSAGALLAAKADAVPLAGMLDPTLNNGEPVQAAFGNAANYPMAVLGTNEGKVLVAGHARNAADAGYSAYVSRFLADGTLDAGFGGTGTLRIGDGSASMALAGAVFGGQGMTLLVGTTTVGALVDKEERAWMARIGADGNIDSSFGTAGQRVVACTTLSQCSYTSVAREPDGHVLALGVAREKTGTARVTFVDRYNADGTPDAGFGVDGRIELSGSLSGFSGAHLQLDGQGRMVIAGTKVSSGNDAGMIVRMTMSGIYDSTWSSDGVASKAIDAQETGFQRAALQKDGRIVAVGCTTAKNGDETGRAVRFNADGTLDLTFGVQGVASVGSCMLSAGIQSDGKVVVAGYSRNQETGAPVAVVARLGANGQLDTSFNHTGFVTPAGLKMSLLNAMAIDADDRIVVGAAAQVAATNQFDAYLLARYIGAEQTATVVEFYNPALNHYFITADAAEAAAVDAGAAGAGWSRTGQAWKSGGTARACRFYGSPEIDAQTQRRKGPNSHFWTIDSDECAVVQQDAGWKFEGYDFAATPKYADGSCAAGSIAVKRLYNNRFQMNDSNHRYTTSDALYAVMVASGWVGEGTVFCAPL